MDKKIAWGPQYGFRDPGFASYLKARIRDAIRDWKFARDAGNYGM